jgi:circadian clock protein KaiC
MKKRVSSEIKKARVFSNIKGVKPFLNIKKVKVGVKEVKEKKVVKSGKEKFMRTYIEGFDKLCPDGIPVGNSVLVEGGPGNGKTIFCLNLVKTMCDRGKKVLYMSFEEREERLMNHIEIFGGKPQEYKKKGLLYVKRFNALDIARSVEALLSEAKKELLIDVQPILIPPEFKPDIVLIDSLSSIASAFSGEQSRFRIYMEQLFRYLEGHDITSFLIREVSNPSHIGNAVVEEGEAVSFLSDGIIVLYNVFYKTGFRKRAIEILKMRGVNIDRRMVECEIKKGKGIVVHSNRLLKGDFVLT